MPIFGKKFNRLSQVWHGCWVPNIFDLCSLSRRGSQIASKTPLWIYRLAQSPTDTPDSPCTLFSLVVRCGLRCQYLPDLRALGEKGNQTHFPTAHRAQQRELLIDAGGEHFPHVAHRQPLRWQCKLGRVRDRIALRRRANSPCVRLVIPFKDFSFRSPDNKETKRFRSIYSTSGSQTARRWRSLGAVRCDLPEHHLPHRQVLDQAGPRRVLSRTWSVCRCTADFAKKFRALWEDEIKGQPSHSAAKSSSW